MKYIYKMYTELVQTKIPFGLNVDKDKKKKIQANSGSFKSWDRSKNNFIALHL